MRDWITVKEASITSGYTVQHLIRLVREDKLGGRKFGRFWVVAPQSLTEYIEEAHNSSDKRRGPRSKQHDRQT